MERKIARRCAVYTRVSTDSGLEQDFNSLDNQREASEAYVKSQAHEGWKLARERYDVGGFSGGPMERPAVQKLLDDVRARKIDVIVVYKVDRLTRSLADFAKLVELFDRVFRSLVDGDRFQPGRGQFEDRPRYAQGHSRAAHSRRQEPGHWHGRDCAGARGEQHQRKHRVGQRAPRTDCCGNGPA